MKLFFIGCGGFVGAVSRFLVSSMVMRMIPCPFPMGTLVVNLIGCYLIGLGNGCMETRNLFSPEMRSFVFVGFLGGFTTYSTFSLESVHLLQSGRALWSVLYLGMHLMVGLCAVLAGYGTARILG